VDSGIGGPEDTATAVATWVTRHLVRPAAQQRGDRDGGGGDPGGDERSWNRIAAALGVSRQAARQRFGGKVGA
jgi:hypothetical protein